MFKKILIANRGEIACRVIRTAKRMGIATVAVYSDADARSPHVLMADESVRPRPAAGGRKLSPRRADPARLPADRRRGGPSRLWLPQRARELRPAARGQWHRLHRPAAEGHRRDGRQDRSRRSSPGPPASASCPASSARSATPTMPSRSPTAITYPVMMKASAGGGGKGMRLAYSETDSETDVRETFESVRREAKSSFGDDRVFIEKFVESPRHIEIQLLGDKHGNIVYLNERDCSIQRPPPEGRRGIPLSLRHPRDARGDGRGGGRARRRRRLHLGRHGRVHRRGRSQLLLSQR